MSKNPKIKPLSETIMIVELDSFTEKFDHEMDKEDKKIKKMLNIAFIPFGVCVGLSIITLNVIPLMIGTVYIGTTAIIKLIREDQKYEKKLDKKYNLDSKVITLESEEADFDFLNEPIITQKETDFHSEYFKSLSNNAEPRVKLTIVGKEEKVELKGSEKTPDFLDKEETMIQVSSEYRTYNIAYNLPPLTISNEEWDNLFDTVYHKLEECNQIEKFYDYMSFLQRYVIAYALVHKKKNISYKSFIDQIPRMTYLGLTQKDIKDIAEKLNSYAKPAQILKVDFNTFKHTK